jgi:formylglycine-generating enzyme
MIMRSRRFLPLAVLMLASPLLASTSSGARAGGRARAGAGGMVRIPAGAYRRLHAGPGAGMQRVGAFALDRRAVTRGSFLAFVRRHPGWRRGAVPAALADASYLADWAGALDAGGGDNLERPVTGVSWYAANAYCVAQGKRLPTLDEWEYAAAASETRRDASDDPAFRRRLLALYAARRSTRIPVVGTGAPNVYGVHDLHGAVSEWTRDAGPRTAHDANDAPARHGHAATALHPVGCASAAIGAVDPADYPAFLRSALRAGLTARTTLGALGFRCAA